MKIELTDKQVEVIAESLIYMGTEWGHYVGSFKHFPEQFVGWTEESKKEVRSQYRIARNILPKLGYDKDNI